MSATKRLLAAVGVIIAVILAAVAFTSASASAACPYSNCNTGGVSDETPSAGGTVDFSGSGFTPGETVDLSEHSTPFDLGTTTAHSDGTFAAQVTLSPDLVGTHTLVAVGETSGHTVSVTVQIAGAGTGGQHAGGSGSGSGNGSGGGLAATGVAVIGIGSLGVVLLAGGGLMLMAGRRRQKVNV